MDNLDTDALQEVYEQLQTEANGLKQSGDPDDMQRAGEIERKLRALEAHSRLAYPSETFTREELTEAQDELFKMWKKAREIAVALFDALGSVGVRLDSTK